MKIRVEYSDGVFRGGLLKLHKPALHCRMWRGNPNPHYEDRMIDHSGHDHPSYEGSWFLLKMSKNPEVSGPESDSFDHASFAIRLTSPEAVRWFEKHDYETPPDLLRLARAYEGRHDVDEDSESPGVPLDPLTEPQQKVWDTLDGKAMLGKQIAHEIYGKATRPSAVRKHIEAIRRTGRTVANERGVGYFRPDAPPDGLADSSVSASQVTVNKENSDAA